VDVSGDALELIEGEEQTVEVGTIDWSSDHRGHLIASSGSDANLSVEVDSDFEVIRLSCLTPGARGSLRL
jgi:hypothetical protein